MIDMTYLEQGKIYWDEWRFEPWFDRTASGLYRRVDFIKAGIFGEIGRYLADDYIVWKYEPEDFERILNNAKPQNNLMLQRYVFVSPSGDNYFKNRSFMLGFKGFVEVYQYVPLSKRTKQIKDLAQLVDAAHRLALKKTAHNKFSVDNCDVE